MDAAIGWIILLGLFGFNIWLAVVCIQKGKRWFAVLGLIIGSPFLWFGAWRIAKPGSSWALKRYANDPVKTAISNTRFPVEHAKWQAITNQHSTELLYRS